jgi:Leucine-rich repeat (LRR) protein
MKNIVIVVLVIVLAALSYFLVAKESTMNKYTVTENANTTTQSNGNTIDLSGKGLSKVSTDILDDSSVTVFDVSNNNLTGALPAEIRKLSNLEILNASNNKMTGIPAEIGQLSQLKTANFANNNLSGLPLEIGNIKNLDTLDLRGNPNISKQDIAKIQSRIPNTQILTDYNE